MAAELEGTIRGESTHACALLITPMPITDIVPVARTKNGGIQCVYDGPNSESIGLMKADFLGLGNLGVIDMTAKRILDRRGEKVDAGRIPTKYPDDPETMAMFAAGKTEGIFQFNKPFAMENLRRIGPRKITDLPRRHGPRAPGPDAVHRRLRRQPQARRPGLRQPGLREVRRPASRQDQRDHDLPGTAHAPLDVDERLLPNQVRQAAQGVRQEEARGPGRDQGPLRGRAVVSGVPQQFVDDLFENTIVPFGSYAFNQAHSVSYGNIAYVEGYLKCHYRSSSSPRSSGRPRA